MAKSESTTRPPDDADPGSVEAPRPHAAADHHRPFLAHHYQSYKQQFEAGKLGMWIFLLTEILLFGGLFCAYAVYRANHPEIFIYAHHFLDKNLGAINTAVLIFSSFTMAWGVRCAQLNQRKLLMVMLSLTLLCACGFLGIKYVEYKHKWEDGLLWAGKYHPVEHAEPADHAARPPGRPEAQSALQRPEGPRYAGIFFSIYFMMTGLHGLHVLAGMAAIAWILVRAANGHFNSHYFGPVDYVGLYWHLVDLIWIYLFPLLYLIH
ncbi:MAG: cytochrome c oxidase subunit 3 family protein [Pirellulales bacterium]|nr:cytochrome c oxidase subunit 3 family protein [Pirellulales bacterium]